MRRLNRREFAATSTVAVSLIATRKAISGNRDVRIRKNIKDFTAAEVQSLRAGVAAMRARSANDPTSWSFQAGIHGRANAQNQAFNKCQHSSWWFLSWHRAYLLFFERILRVAANDPDLMLPYWDYGDPNHRALPEPFRPQLVGANPNPLFEANRNFGLNQGTAGLPSSAVSTSDAMSRSQFVDTSFPVGFGGGPIQSPSQFSMFRGALEDTPHNAVHGQVGGFNGLMSNPATAALDPIFWLHHANIDRLWEVWLNLSPSHTNPASVGTWGTQAFDFFDENGSAVSITSAEVVDTEALGYAYQPAGDDETAPPRAPFGQLVFAMNQSSLKFQFEEIASGPVSTDSTESPMPPVVLGRENLRVKVGLKADELATLAKNLAAPKQDENPRRLVMQIEGLRFDQAPGAHYEVYVNLPEGQEPQASDPSYIGNLTFFDLVHAHDASDHEDAHPSNRLFDLTDDVERLEQSARLGDDQISLTFVRRGLEPLAGQESPLPPGPQQEATFRKVSIGIGRVIQSGDGPD